MTFKTDLKAAADVLRTRTGIHRDEAYTHLIVGVRALERLGWKIVWPEVTKEMREAGINASSVIISRESATKNSERTFRAMLAAAPTIDDLLSADSAEPEKSQ